MRELGALLTAMVWLAHCAPPAAAAERSASTGMRIDPTEVALDMFYGGTSISVEAEVPLGYDVAVSCVGRTDAVELKKKGKVLGVFWMSVSEVEFRDVPLVYMLNTSRKLEELAPPLVLERLGVGYRALEVRSLGSSDEEEDQALFTELVELKESEGLYSLDEGGVALGPAEGGTIPASTEFFLPAKAPVGEYEILLFGFKEGYGELLGKKRVELNRTGAAEFISSLAASNGLLYGILAVVIAIAVGLCTGVVFGLRLRERE